MLHLFATIIHPRHFWRNVKLSELSELYISMTLKSLALSLVAIFIPVYLYQQGFSISQILIYFALYFALRSVLDLAAGWLTARFGPKHMLSYSYVLLVVFLGLLLTMPDFGWPLQLIALIQALFNSFFFVSYHVDFSKVHSIEKGGAELSWMNILVRTGAAVGPFVGGLLATIFSINAAIMLSLVLVLMAIWPLMLSAEPVKSSRKVNFSHFSLRNHQRTLMAYAGLIVSRQVGLVIWPLYIAVFIFTDDVYAKVGLVTSVSITVSLLVARLYGRLIDKKDGGKLLTISSWLSAGIHLLRPSVATLGGVTLINTSSELAETGVILPFTKGFYDDADSSADRIAYIATLESIMALIRGLFFLVLIIIAMNFGEQTALISSFYLASAATLLTTAQRFKALEP